MELLPREEVALLLGTLTACGFLILGALELVWPTAPRRRATRPSRALAAPPAPAVRPPAPLAVRRPLPPAPPPLQAARLLLDRARAEVDLERRVTILTRAVAGLTRSAQAAPEDEALATALVSARTLLWETWERIAQARLAAAMPWRAEAPTTVPAPTLTRTR